MVARPEDCSHAHRARFASRVKTVTPEEMIFDPPTSKPDRIHFGVTGWIVFLRGLIDGSHQHLTRLRVYDHGPEWYRRIRCQGSFSESDQADHLLLIKGRAFERLGFLPDHRGVQSEEQVLFLSADAGTPPVRFGGRGANRVPTPIRIMGNL